MATLKKLLTLALFLLIALSPVGFAATYSHSLCNNPQYTCYKLKRTDSFNKLFNNSQHDIDLVRRVNRINTEVYPGTVIAIPKNLSSADAMSFSPFSKQITPAGEKVIIVSLSKLAWGAYDAQGRLVRWGPASGARGYCPDIHQGCHTPLGKFFIYHKEGAHCFSTRFPVPRGGAPMPYCMFFHGGYALHGSYEVPGYNASHGCVRLFVQDAQWLNEEFTTGTKNVTVIVSGS